MGLGGLITSGIIRRLSGDWMWSLARPEAATSRSPRIVYHYTTSDGLLGILESKKIRATAVEYLNDSKELTFAVDSASSFIRTSRDKLFPGVHAPLADLVLTGLTQRYESGVFVACFCTNGDRLSQWRGYADRGLGFALGFVGRRLTKLQLVNGADVLNVRFGRCSYTEKSLHASIEDWCNRTREKYDQMKLGTNRMIQKLLPRILEAAASRMIGQYAPFVKHPQFQEEQEWRLVVDGLIDGGNVIKVRRGGAGLVPYVEIALTGVDGRLPLTRVIVGPSAQGELARRAAFHALEANGISKRNESEKLVRVSEIPFRSW